MEEETLSLIIHGCKLARNLESHLPHLSTTTQPPNVLSNSCEEILRVFQSVVSRLMSLSTSTDDHDHDHDHHHHLLHPHPSSILSSSVNTNINIPHDQVVVVPAAANYGALPEPPRPMSKTTELDASVQEWLKSSYTQAIETHAAAQFSSILSTTTDYHIVDVHHHHKNPFSSSRMLLSEQEAQEQEQEQQTPEEAAGSDSGHNYKTITATTTTPVVVQRSRKRKDGADKRTVTVAGPRIGNMEIPPDDGFTWRKYGQKEILGSMFPRGYYRCTHKNFFGCEAKKQVQRLDLDPNTYEVTYYGVHTCQMGGMMPMGGGGGRSGGGGVPSTSSSSSQVLLPDDHDQYQSNMVVELVDAMFNTTTSGGGTSSNNISMDSIFLPSPSQAQAHQQQHHYQKQQHNTMIRYNE